jgi:predicted aconitase
MTGDFCARSSGLDCGREITGGFSIKLTREEREMLEGKRGYPAQKSLEMLIALGECFDAEKLLPIESSHLLYSLDALGRGGYAFVHKMAEMGGRFRVFTDTNPSSIDACTDICCSATEVFVQEQRSLAERLSEMGAFLSNTCAPYLSGHIPLLGQHVAWNESSAVAFANSVLGARANREGGPSAFAAAITGRTPNYGFHLSEKRLGELEIVVSSPLEQAYDYGTLGFFAGKIARDKVPVFKGIGPSCSWDGLKQLSAAIATSGSVALYHIVGITPEALSEELAFGGNRIRESEMYEFSEADRRDTMAKLSTSESRETDLIIFGCPHASITELQTIARYLEGKRLAYGTLLWTFTSRMTKAYAEDMGYIRVIEAAGGKIFSDACPVWLFKRLKEAQPRVIATDSAKLASTIDMYRAEGKNLGFFYGSAQECVEAGIRGHKVQRG